MSEQEKCPHCGQTVRAGNFCPKCGRKIADECDCWGLKRRHNCGQDKCPGVRVTMAK